MARRTRFKSTWRDSGLTGIEWSLTLKYAAALSNAAWADAGTTLNVVEHDFQLICEKEMENQDVHLRLADPLNGACPVAVCLNRHENGLSPARCRRTCA